MTAVAKLLPCPFCGGSNLIVSRMHGTGDRYVVCQTPECKTCGPSGDAREDAIATWNRRADELEAALSPAELGGVEAVPLVQSSAPERIWLAVADDAYYADQPFPNGLEEVCWSSDAPLEVCVPYVRADLSTPRAAEAVTDELIETFCLAAEQAAGMDEGCYERLPVGEGLRAVFAAKGE